MQTRRSGTSVIARRPCSSPPSKAIVPVSAQAAAHVVTAPSSASSAAGGAHRPRSPRTCGAERGVEVGRDRHTRRSALGQSTGYRRDGAEAVRDDGAGLADPLDEELDDFGRRAVPDGAVAAWDLRRRRLVCESVPDPPEDGVTAAAHVPPTIRGRSARRRRAGCGSGPSPPAARKPAQSAVTEGGPLERAGDALGPLVALGARESPGEEAQRASLEPRLRAADDLRALVDEDPRDVDPDGADVGAAPQRLEAKGSEAATPRSPSSCGCRIAPIGPA